MKFGLFFQMQLPKPLDSDDWYPGQEALQIHIGTIITQMILQNNHPVKMEAIELVGTKALPEFKERYAQHFKWCEQQLNSIDALVNSSIEYGLQ